MDIAYFSPRQERQREHNLVFARVALELQHLTFGELRLALRSYRRQDVDGVLHILAGFKTYLFRTEHTPPIGIVNVEKMEVK